MSEVSPRPEVLCLKPYVPSRPADEIRQAYGLSRVVCLSANESPLGPSRKVIEAVRTAVHAANRYPESTADTLRAALAKHLGLPVDQFFVGCGSDEVIRLLAASYIRTGDRVLIPACTFPNYRAVAQLFGAVVEEVPLRHDTIDLDAMAPRAPGARLLFLCRPNNPTGTVFPENAFRHFLDSVPTDTLVILDEAYHEYDETSFDSLDLLRQHPHLVITRTFSKAYGLAGMRAGYGIARPEIWTPLYRAREPFTINSLAQAAAQAALEDQNHLAATVALAREGRRRLYQIASDLGLGHIPSQGNFVMIDLGRPAEPVCDALLQRGVMVRPCSGFGRPHCIRVTVGLPEELEALASALAQVGCTKR